MESISILICTRNRPHMIGDTVRDILNGEDPGIPLDVLVVDQSDDRRSAEVVGALARNDRRLRYLSTNAQGIAASRNLCIAASRGDLLAYTDDDCRVPPDWARQIVQLFREDPELGAIFGRVLPAEDDSPEPGRMPIGMRRYKQPRFFRRCPSFLLDNLFRFGGSNNMAVRRSVVRQVGPFDEFMWGGEDLDYFLRLLQADVPTRYAPEVLLYHRAWRDAAGTLQRNREYHEMVGMVIAKHLFYKTRRSREIAIARRLQYLLKPMAKSLLTLNRRRLAHNIDCWRSYHQGMQHYLERTPQPTSWREVAGAERLYSS